MEQFVSCKFEQQLRRSRDQQRRLLWYFLQKTERTSCPLVGGMFGPSQTNCELLWTHHTPQSICTYAPAYIFLMQLSFSLTPPTKTMCSPSWHCLIGRHEHLSSHLPCCCTPHTLVRFISVYTVNLSLLCNLYLSPFFVVESCKSPFLIFFCERHLVFNYFFFVLVVLMCVS